MLPATAYRSFDMMTDKSENVGYFRRLGGAGSAVGARERSRFKERKITFMKL